MQEKIESVKNVLERVKYNATHNREFDVYAVESALTTLESLQADIASEEMVEKVGEIIGWYRYDSAIGSKTTAKEVIKTIRGN